jgi:hypothetical protein
MVVSEAGLRALNPASIEAHDSHLMAVMVDLT